MRPLSWLKNSIPYLWARHAPEQPRAASPVSHLSAVIRGQTKGVNGALQLDPAKNLMLLESLSSLVRVLFESYSSLVRVGRVLFEFGRVMSSSAQLGSAQLFSRCSRGFFGCPKLRFRQLEREIYLPGSSNKRCESRFFAILAGKSRDISRTLPSSPQSCELRAAS